MNVKMVKNTVTPIHDFLIFLHDYYDSNDCGDNNFNKELLSFLKFIFNDSVEFNNGIMTYYSGNILCSIEYKKEYYVLFEKLYYYIKNINLTKRNVILKIITLYYSLFDSYVIDDYYYDSEYLIPIVNYINDRHLCMYNSFEFVVVGKIIRER